MSRYFIGSRRNGGETKFLRLGSEGVQLRLIETEDGYPEAFEHWVEGVGKSLACPGYGCPLCAARHPRRRRVMLGVIVKNGGDLKVMVLDAGDGLLRAIDELSARLSRNGSDLRDYTLIAFRMGERYTVNLGETVSEAAKREYEALARNNPLDLEKFVRKVDMEALRLAAGVPTDPPKDAEGYSSSWLDDDKPPLPTPTKDEAPKPAGSTDWLD